VYVHVLHCFYNLLILLQFSVYLKIWMSADKGGHNGKLIYIILFSNWSLLFSIFEDGSPSPAKVHVTGGWLRDRLLETQAPTHHSCRGSISSYICNIPTYMDTYGFYYHGWKLSVLCPCEVSAISFVLVNLFSLLGDLALAWGVLLSIIVWIIVIIWYLYIYILNI